VSAPAKGVDTSCDRSASEAAAADNRIEIELLNGRRVRVGPRADMGALTRILEIADGRRP
jgi:transposase